MTEISFYHLTTTPLEKGLPQLLFKIIGADHRVVLRVPDEETMQLLDKVIWTFSTNKFVPHGTMHEQHKERQPVYITTEDECPNNADILVTVGNLEPENISNYKKYLFVFDGKDDALIEYARERWKQYAANDDTKLTYWKQDASGAWQQGAG